MSATSCVSIPQIGGEDSILYRGLQKAAKGRPNTNWAYCAYLYPGVADAMDNDGYKRNNQGQHNARDVAAFLDLASMSTQRLNLDEIAKRFGATDDVTGNLIDFTDSEKALKIAKKINDTYAGKSKSPVARSGAVAYVTQNSGIFNVIVLPRDANTQFRAVEIETASQIWDKAKQVFGPLIDLNTLTPMNNIINAVGAYDMVTSLNGLARLDNKHISERDIRTLFEIYRGDSQVQRLVTAFGNIEEAARQTYNAFQTRGRSVTSMQFSLMDATLTNLKWFPGIDIAQLKADADFIKGTVSATMPEGVIQKKLEDLDNDYNINIEEYHRGLKEVQSLKELTEDMIFTLKREQRELEAVQGVTPESIEMRDKRFQIINELKNRRYYLGILGYLDVAMKKMQEVEQLYIDASNVTGTTLEKGLAMVDALNDIKRDLQGYKASLIYLANIDSIIASNETLSDADKLVIETKAKDALDLIRNKEAYHARLRDTAMTYVVSSFMGDYAPDGQTIADLVTMSQLDSTFQDRWLYSMARASNPLIATIGGIVNEEKIKGNKKHIEIDNRVTRADNKLKRAKDGSRKPKRFMYHEYYDDEGNLTDIYIASNIQWDKYKKARSMAMSAAMSNGLRDEELEMHMQQWEMDNTEDRIVDNTNMRTERVPDSRYQIPEADFRKSQFKTKAEEEYYDTMMQIKGELGSLMPFYAQKQFLPPQKRRTSFDTIGENPLLTGKAILNKIKDTFLIREDDPFFANNGIIVEGQDYGIGIGTIDNTAYKQIPIFFINKLKDQAELLKDFSGSIMALAGTAINYDSMNRIRDTVEFMSDYISSKTPPETDVKNNRKAETFVEKGKQFTKEIANWSNNVNTIAMLEGFAEKFLFGVNVKNPSYKTKLGQLFLNYVSRRSLSANVKGATANALIGEYQTLIEAIGGEFFSFQDWVWAQGAVLGMNTKGVFSINTKGVHGRIVDFFRNDKTSKSVLLGELFDVLNENNTELSNKRFHRGFLRHIFSQDLSFIGYGMGEHIIHYVNMFAILHGTKVRLDGKEVPLYKAFDTTDPIDGVSELKFKGRVQWAEKVGTSTILHEVTGLDDPFIDEVRRIIKHVNHQCHGAMNTEDKGLIHQRMVGKAVMSLRQWSIEHYSRRYREEYFDANLKKPRKGGMHRQHLEYTIGKWSRNAVGRYIINRMKKHPEGSIFYNMAKEIQRFEAEVAIKKKDMTKEQRAAIRKARAEYVTTGLLFLLNFAFPPEDFKGRFFARFWIYQLKRALMEIGASAPTLLLPIEAVKMVNSPIAGVSTFNSFIYIAYGLVNGDLFKEVKSGKYKGMNKYWRNFLKYVVPYYNQLDGLIELATEDSGFGFFDFRP